MSVAEGVPTLPVRLANPLLGVVYPEGGWLEALVDTGYEGFVSVPRSVFEALRLRVDEERRLVLADGRVVRSLGGYGSLLSGDYGADGLIETYEGLGEVLVGVDALRLARLEVDFCLGVVRVKRC